MALNVGGLVRDAMSIIGGTVSSGTVSLTYRLNSGSTIYDPATGAVTPSLQNIAVTHAILTSYRLREVEAAKNSETPILVADQKLLIAYADLPVEPTSADTVLIGGVVWSVIRHSVDPVKSLHTFQIRRA